jgi:uncharacterized protein (DUF433 family)
MLCFSYRRPLWQNAHPLMLRTPAVCGGKTIIEGTRIGVHDVIDLIPLNSSLQRVFIFVNLCQTFL